MADTKTFKDIDKRLQKLVDETKANFKVSAKFQKKLDEHALGLIEKLEDDRKPRAKVQKEMLRVLETQEAQEKVRNRDKVAADFKMGKATIEELKAARLTKQDLLKSGFGNISSSFQIMSQGFTEVIGKFTSAIKGWWENIKENSAVLRAARKFWQSTAVTKFKDLFSHVSGIIGSHMREVLGEFAEVFDVFKRVFGAIKDTIVNAFSGMFDALKEQKKIRREKKMVAHLKKIQDGIGFLVKGDKVDDLKQKVKKSGAGILGSIMKFLGIGTGLGIGAAILSALVAGGSIALLGKMIYDGMKQAIEGWLTGGMGGASKGFLMGISKIPRAVLAWLLDIFGYEKLASSLSDESMSNFIDKMNEGIQKFMDDIVNWFSNTWTSLINMLKAFWNASVDKIPFIGPERRAALKSIISTDDAIASARDKNKNLAKETLANPGATKAAREGNIKAAIITLQKDKEALKNQMAATGQDNSQAMKDLGLQIKELNDNMEKSINAAPVVIPGSNIYGISGVGPGGGVNLNTVPNTDQTLNMKNNNFYGMGSRSDKRLKRNIRYME